MASYRNRMATARFPLWSGTTGAELIQGRVGRLPLCSTHTDTFYLSLTDAVTVVLPIKDAGWGICWTKN